MQNHAVDPFGIVGQVLDAQFRVDRLVGEGGFSAVYRGHHLGLEEPIAIKCLKLPPSLSPQLVEQFAKRFRDESRILYRLSQGNLNIVRSIAAGTWQASTGAIVPYMILEWMEGRSLANEFTIRRTVGQKGRSLEEVVKLFGSAADGLAHAHAQGVVHRDLNPGNLFLAATPQGTRMKVLDFGVAKILDESTLNIARTQTVGQIRIFAPAYGAPEQFDDTIGKVGAASDVYAFALILLEALRDRCVNEGTHLGEFAQKAIDPNRRPTPRMFGLEVTDEVEQIFARATKLDPRERWQSAGELWQALAIAASAASQQKHARAAMETPALAMPQGSRSTKTGMAPPPAPAKPPALGPLGTTMPLGTALPNLNLPRPGTGSAPRTPVPPPAPRSTSSPRLPVPPNAARASTPSAPRIPARPSAPDAAAPPGGTEHPSTQRFPGELSPSVEDDKDVPTRIGAAAGEDLDEPEDEVTRVRAPEPDVLRGLAELDARARPGMASTQVSRAGSPRPAAGMSAAGTLQPPSAGPPPLPPESAPISGGTVMMAPGAPGAHGSPPPMPSHLISPHAQAMPSAEGAGRPSSGQHPLGHTLPLAGPHPLGTPGQPSSSGPLPAAGAPPQPSLAHQQPQPQPYSHAPPHPQHPMLQPAPHLSVQTQGPAFAQPQHFGRMGDAMSTPPASTAGAPKKNNTVLFVAIGMGSLALIGIVLALIVLVGKKGEARTKAAASEAAPASTPSASAPPPEAPPPPPEAPPPPPVAVPEPLATAEEATDASVAADTDEAVDAGAAATTASAPAPAPPPVPVPVAVVVKDAGPPPDPNAFNEATARSRLGQANGILVFCKKEGGVTGPGTASVTFATDGTVSSVTMDPPYAGTPAGDCVAGHFKRTKVSPFQGSPQTLKHSFEVPK